MALASVDPNPGHCGRRRARKGSGHFAEKEGYIFNGHHHEIYISGPETRAAGTTQDDITCAGEGDLGDLFRENVTEYVEAEHGQRNCKPGKYGELWRGEEIIARILEHQPPTGIRGLRSQAEE